MSKRNKKVLEDPSVGPVLRALNSSIRRLMLFTLRDAGSDGLSLQELHRIISSVGPDFDISNSGLHRHCEVLYSAGLIERRRKLQQTVVSFNRSGFQSCLAWLKVIAA
jgi:DNA-binding transcriptional ArsR family regulator